MSPIQQYFYISQMIESGFCMVTSIATLVLLYVSIKISVTGIELTLTSKRADTFAEFNRRYGALWQLRANPDVIRNPIIFYEQFWVLQHDQFQAWRDGSVSDEVFYFWSQVRHDDWKQDRSLGDMSYRQGFTNATERWMHSGFDKFIEEVHAFGIERAKRQFGEAKQRMWLVMRNAKRPILQRPAAGKVRHQA